MTPQELREEFEATFAGFVRQIDAIYAQDRVNREDPTEKSANGRWLGVVDGARKLLDLREVSDNDRDAPYTSVHMRAVELWQVATHVLAIYGQSEHWCSLLGKTYTDTGGVAAHTHACEILGHAKFKGLLRMVHASNHLLLLFDHENIERFKGNMELVVATFVECADTPLMTQTEMNAQTVVIPFIGTASAEAPTVIIPRPSPYKRG
ncbi:MAG TPA: hypothetical protein VFO38_06625 [Candidatus Saccharimonadales bacterium]|nr:hypothetical protein [Candidatus Saccharimonadales bacterium]